MQTLRLAAACASRRWFSAGTGSHVNDRVLLKGLRFYGYHGVYDVEREIGQPFHVDLELGVDLREAGDSDDLQATVDYGQVYKAVKDVVEQEQYQLLERVGDEIVQRVLDNFPKVHEVGVEVKKPEVQVGGELEFLGVRMWRKREGEE